MSDKKKKKHESYDEDGRPNKKQNKFTVECASKLRSILNFIERITGTGLKKKDDDINVSSAHTSINSLNLIMEEGITTTEASGPGERSPLIDADGGNIGVQVDGGGEHPDLFSEVDEDEGDLDAKFPQEKIKTVIIFLILFLVMYLNTVSLVLTHQRQLNSTITTRTPLPDIILDNIPTVDNALFAAEVIIITSFVTTISLIIFHRFRWIVFRRCCFIVGILYFIRSFTIYMTVFPTASYTYYCSPKLNSTSVLVVMREAMNILSGFGLSMNGKHVFCGDYMYSGHTITLVLAYLFVQEYGPRSSWKWILLHWFFWAFSFTGIILILISRGHYTIDIVIAYFMTTRMFWIYHTMANIDDLKEPTENNFISRVWWFCAFRWLEGNVHGVLPRQYSLPYSNYYYEF